MKFKLDENIPRGVASRLREFGHDAITLLEQAPAGIADTEVARLVRNEGRALLTLDLDFADIRAYRPSDYSGIIVLRLRRAGTPAIYELIDRLALAIEQEPVLGRLWIVEQDRIRIRGDQTEPSV